MLFHIGWQLWAIAIFQTDAYAIARDFHHFVQFAYVLVLEFDMVLVLSNNIVG